MTSSSPGSGQAEPRIDRVQPWLSAALSVLLHVLLAILLMLAEPPPLVTTPQWASSGGRVKVDFVGESAPAEPDTPAPPSPAPTASPAPPSKPVLLEQIDPSRLLLAAEPVLPPDAPQPEHPPTPQPPVPRPAPARSAAPSDTAQRRPETWTGRPPGLLEEDIAREEYGPAPGPARRDGYRNDPYASEPSMEVGGYQVVYDLLGELRLRGWMENGMTEVAIPLPGTEYWMVCPAEVALRRGSSKCRLLHPSSPEMDTIGDARDVITVMYVYRQGEIVWRGPGPYR